MNKSEWKDIYGTARLAFKMRDSNLFGIFVWNKGKQINIMDILFERQFCDTLVFKKQCRTPNILVTEDIPF